MKLSLPPLTPELRQTRREVFKLALAFGYMWGFGLLLKAVASHPDTGPMATGLRLFMAVMFTAGVWSLTRTSKPKPKADKSDK